MSSDLLTYYQTNFTKCEIDNSFLSSWQGLAYPSHIIQMFSLPVQVLTFWLIIKKTPESMKSVKRPLLFAHFWGTFLDLVVGVLFTPYIFLPSITFVGVGILSWIGMPQEWQLAIALITISSLNFSLIYLFESRSSSIENNRFRIRSTILRTFYFIINYAISSIILISLFHIPENQDEAKMQLLQLNPCPSSEFFTSSALVLVSDPYWINIMFNVLSPISLLNAVGNVCFHAICSIYYLYIAPSTFVSVQTRHLQRRFFMGTVVQTLVPTVICAIPYTVISFAAASDKITQTVTNTVILVIGCHGIIQTIKITLVHKVYRHHVLLLASRLRVKNGDVLRMRS